MKTKSLNRQVVRMAATMLMLAEGNTTTPRVRQYLRDRNYRAGQSEVSSWLLRIAGREGWVITDNGRYRIYQFPAFTARLQMPALPTLYGPGMNQLTDRTQ